MSDRDHTLTVTSTAFLPTDVPRWPRRKHRLYIQTANPNPIDSYVLPIVIGCDGATKIRVRYPRCDLRGWF